MSNKLNVVINYLSIPERILRQSKEEIELGDKTEDEVLQGLFNVRSVKVADGAYAAIEVVGVQKLEEEKEEEKEGDGN